jgi:hypothetical protein
MNVIAAAGLALFVAPLFASDLSASHVLQSIVPALPYTSSCRSRVVLLNTGDIPVKVEVEGHAETGALVAPSGHASRSWLAPQEQVEYRCRLKAKPKARGSGFANTFRLEIRQSSRFGLPASVSSAINYEAPRGR